MQITVRLLRAVELAGLTPDEIVANSTRDVDEGGFSSVDGEDEAWSSDSMILHAAFLETIEGIGKVPSYLHDLAMAIDGSDELDVGEVAEAEGAISGSVTLSTVDRLLGLLANDQGRSAKALVASEPVDEEILPSDLVDYLGQWNRTLTLAGAQRACIVISQG